MRSISLQSLDKLDKALGEKPERKSKVAAAAAAAPAAAKPEPTPAAVDPELAKK